MNAATPRFRFGEYDRIAIGNVAYKHVATSEHGHVFARLDNNLAEEFTHSRFAKLSRRADFRFDLGFFLPEEARVRLAAPVQHLSDLPPKERARVLSKLDFAYAFLHHEEKGDVNRSSDKLDEMARLVHDAVKSTFRGRALAEYEAEAKRNKDGRPRKQHGGGPDVPSPRPYSGTTILNIVKLLEQHNFNPLVLASKRELSGNRHRRFGVEAAAVLGEHVRRYAAENRPTMVALHGDYQRAVRAKNKERGLSGPDAIVALGRKTFCKEIRKLPAFEVYAGRYGLEAAKRRFAVVTTGPDVVRVGQRLEMDEWRGQLHTLLANLGILDRLTPEQRAQIPKIRIIVYGGLCRACRCFATLRFAYEPSAEEAKAAFAMVGVDKTALARAAGAQTPWDIVFRSEQVVSDAGAYIGEAYRLAVADSGVAWFVPPSGTPQMRGAIERVFGTMHTQVVSRATGRTFENVVARGDYESEGRATLTVEDFLRMVVIWVCDVYHNSPHGGLGGETPRNAFLRLSERYGVLPPLDKHARRSIFGVELERVVGARGIRVLGLFYQSLELQEHRRRVGDVPLEVRVDRFDLARISVKVDGTWIEARCTRAQFNDVSVDSWLEASKELRLRFKAEAEVSRAVVDEALDRIESINAGARLRAELGPTTFGAWQIADAEEKTLLGFNLPDDPDEDDPVDEVDLFAGAIPVTGTLEQDVPAAKRRPRGRAGTSPVVEHETTNGGAAEPEPPHTKSHPRSRIGR